MNLFVFLTWQDQQDAITKTSTDCYSLAFYWLMFFSTAFFVPSAMTSQKFWRQSDCCLWRLTKFASDSYLYTTFSQKFVFVAKVSGSHSHSRKSYQFFWYSGYILFFPRLYKAKYSGRPPYVWFMCFDTCYYRCWCFRRFFSIENLIALLQNSFSGLSF